MNYLIEHDGRAYPYVSRDVNEAERLRFIGNGYNPPNRIRENKPEIYRYLRGELSPNYPVPAIPTRVEYIFQGFAIDGIFVRVEDYLVAGAYRDGMELIGYPCVPYEFDYPDFD